MVENNTVCAAVSASISYSSAKLELLREVGKELAINNDFATTPVSPKPKITSNAVNGPITKRVKQLTKTVLVNYPPLIDLAV